MDKKELKKIMNDLAAGHITKKEADKILKSKKTHQNKPNKKFEGKPNARKRTIKSKEVK